MAMRRRMWPWGACALFALGAAYLWFFVQVPAPRREWALDLSEVRRLAGTLGGAKPTQVRVERVCQFKFPAAVIRAGDGWGLRPMECFSYQLVYPDHSAVIDTALTQPLPGGTVDAGAVQRLGRALSKADLIVLTHEHADHLGGLVAQPNLAQLLKVAKLNREQVSHPELLGPAGFPRGALDGYQPVTYDKYLAVAPGVVLVRAAGHTPGSQLVYVQRADGTEYLFLGDVAWYWKNVETVRGRPRAMAMAIHEDRAPVSSQLDALHRLVVTEPAVHQVPGHDPAVVDRLLSQHLLEPGFAL